MHTGKLKAQLWKLMTLPIVGIIYCAVISEGLRLKVPALGLKLSKLPIPGFSSLERYTGLYRLDLAHVMAILLMLACWYLWVIVLTLLCIDMDYFFGKKWKPVAYSRIVLTLAAVILGADALLFYAAMLNQGGLWGGESVVSIPAFLATAAYVCILVFLALVTVNLQHGGKETAS